MTKRRSQRAYALYITTCASAAEAKRLSLKLLQAKLVACVNVVPRVRSYYRWQGKVEQAQEWMLLMKSGSKQQGKIEALLQKEHRYTVFELIRLPIESGSRQYLNWLAAGIGE